MNEEWAEAQILQFQSEGVGDRGLAEFIHEIFFSTEALRSLLALVPSSRRVFKQLCMKGDVPYLVHILLMEIGEIDLAFRVLMSHDTWSSVASLYDSPGVSRRSRDLAFRKALKQRDWIAVMQMVDSVTASVGNCRRAFLEMVRWEELSLAAELCGRVYLSDGDVDFALRACLNLAQWDRIAEFLKLLHSLTGRRTLLRQIVTDSILSGKLNCLLSLAQTQNRALEDRKFLRTVFTLALNARQVKFVLDFCRACVRVPTFLQDRVLRSATTAAIKAYHWRLVKKLFRLNPDCFSTSHFSACLHAISRNTANGAWRVCCPVLEDWCEEEGFLVWEFICDWCTDYNDVFSGELADWCLRHTFPHLAILLSLSSQNFERVIRTLEDFGGVLKDSVLIAAASLMLAHFNPEAVALVLQYLEVEEEAIKCLKQSRDHASLPRLMVACRERGLRPWTVTIAVLTSDWAVAEDELKECSDLCAIDFAIVEAAIHGRAGLLQSVIDRRPLTQEVLAGALGQAVVQGHPECFRLLVDRLDPCLLPEYGDALLLTALDNVWRREEMVKLCIATGVSTRALSSTCCNGALVRFQDPGRPSVMRRALEIAQLPIVRLLYKSGATSNEELYRLKSKRSLRARLRERGRRDVIQYLKALASNPRSLRDICRLRVSHLIGCRPGRARRLESLPLPHVIRDLVSFSDIF